MNTVDIIDELRAKSRVEGASTLAVLLNAAADKLEELSKPVKATLNRQKRRELAHNGKLEQYMETVYQQGYEQVRSHSYRHAWVCMFVALVERFPKLMTKEMLHSIALDTCDVSKRIEPATELIANLKEQTGFDVDQNPYDSDIEYIEKGDGNG